MKRRNETETRKRSRSVLLYIEFGVLLIIHLLMIAAFVNWFL